MQGNVPCMLYKMCSFRVTSFVHIIVKKHGHTEDFILNVVNIFLYIILKIDFPAYNISIYSWRDAASVKSGTDFNLQPHAFRFNLSKKFGNMTFFFLNKIVYPDVLRHHKVLQNFRTLSYGNKPLKYNCVQMSYQY